MTSWLLSEIQAKAFAQDFLYLSKEKGHRVHKWDTRKVSRAQKRDAHYMHTRDVHHFHKRATCLVTFMRWISECVLIQILFFA